MKSGLLGQMGQRGSVNAFIKIHGLYGLKHQIVGKRYDVTIVTDERNVKIESAKDISLKSVSSP